MLQNRREPAHLAAVRSTRLSHWRIESETATSLGSMAVRTCRVSCWDAQGVEHTAQVTAQSLYEAVAQALRVFREDEWTEDPNRGPASVVATINQPQVEHRVRIKDFLKSGRFRQGVRRDGAQEPFARHHRRENPRHVDPLLLLRCQQRTSLLRAPHRAVATLIAVDKTIQKSRSPHPARFVEPMQCLAVAKLPEGPDWEYEVKFDGYRALGIKSAGRVRLMSRNGNDFSARFPITTQALSKLPDDSAVDGEIVALDETGRPSFNVLQNYTHANTPLQFYAFDLLHLAGKTLRDRPLDDRRELLPRQGDIGCKGRRSLFGNFGGHGRRCRRCG